MKPCFHLRRRQRQNSLRFMTPLHSLLPCSHPLLLNLQQRRDTRAWTFTRLSHQRRDRLLHLRYCLLTLAIHPSLLPWSPLLFLKMSQHQWLSLTLFPSSPLLKNKMSCNPQLSLHNHQIQILPHLPGQINLCYHKIHKHNRQKISTKCKP